MSTLPAHPSYIRTLEPSNAYPSFLKTLGTLLPGQDAFVLGLKHATARVAFKRLRAKHPERRYLIRVAPPERNGCHVWCWHTDDVGIHAISRIPLETGLFIPSARQHDVEAAARADMAKNPNIEYVVHGKSECGVVGCRVWRMPTKSPRKFFGYAISTAAPRDNRQLAYRARLLSYISGSEKKTERLKAMLLEFDASQALKGRPVVQPPPALAPDEEFDEGFDLI